MLACLDVFRFLHFTALMLLAGSLVLTPALAGAGAASIQWRRLQQFLAFLTLVTAIAWWLVLGGILGGDARLIASPAFDMTVLTETMFGHVWVFRMVVAMLVLVLLVSRFELSYLVTGLAVLLLASLALTGHAVAEAGIDELIHVVSEAVHLIAGGLWVGGLAVLTIMVLSRGTVDTRELAQALGRFSGVGYTAVALIVGSGTVNTWFLIPSFEDFVTSEYGALLLIKIGLVSTMILLAANNRFRLLPTLDRQPEVTRERLVRSIGLETGMGLAVVAVVSILGMSSPPGSP
jgi:putative copper resistance protein D